MLDSKDYYGTSIERSLILYRENVHQVNLVSCRSIYCLTFNAVGFRYTINFCFTDYSLTIKCLDPVQITDHMNNPPMENPIIHAKGDEQ